ncbi:phage baseplate assembly protein V [Acinetobacter sp. TGL-Y2]|uniref:phage baseplate assembly protein V n=1 Tax=Acinetobacter sp. TGL-Y2 TaxID=1407071 RepID=UPI000AFF4E5D|nr:phage baseplate assembly protein V [Acinetobacter sp. TGL-Y2]
MSSQLLRQFQNLSSIGTVIAVDASAWKIRLKIDENETDWIPIPTMAAGVVKVWRCPSIGEQFSVSAQGGELTSAVPQISLFSEEFPPPSTDPDEVYIQLGEHFFVVNIASGEAVFKLNKCTFDVFETVFTGTLHAEKAISSNADITSDTDVIAQNISLTKHKTSGVKGGSENSGGPIP